MRKKISEMNILPNFNLWKEYSKIEYLLSENKIIGTYNYLGDKNRPSFTIEQYIDQACFTNWNLRGTFISIDEMRNEIGISKELFTEKNINNEIVLDFLQYAGNCALRVLETIDQCSFAYIEDINHVQVMIDNMYALLSKLGACFNIDQKTSEAFVVYNDSISEIVANENPEIEDSLTEYKRIDNLGNPKRKGEILCTLFKKLESIEAKFKGTSFENLCKDTTFLFNSTGARHWVENDKIASKTFSIMNPKELESWYDKTFTMFLSCMVLSQYLDFKKEINAIKQID